MRTRFVASVASSIVVFLSWGCLGEPVGPSVVPLDTVAFASFSVGAIHACARTSDGRLYCWGANGIAQLGVGDVRDRYVSSRVAQGDARYTQVAAGGGHTCALVSDGSLQCWGLNQYGQLGTGVLSAPAQQPRAVAGSRVYELVRVGGAHSCALDAAGFAWCWGFAESGRLGNGQSASGDYHTIPDSVLTDQPFVDLAVGGFHTCALTAAGTVYCWGRGNEGQLGNGAASNSAVPVAIAGDLEFAGVDVGAYHTCGVTVLGDGYCWGSNAQGQLGIGSGGSRNTPGLVVGDLAFRAVSAGGNHTCGITTGNQAYCWGVNESGQLGNGTTGARGTPGAVSGGLQFQTIEAGLGEGSTATCGRTTGGIVYCWGYGEDGMLGDGLATSSSVPLRVAGQLGG